MRNDRSCPSLVASLYLLVIATCSLYLIFIFNCGSREYSKTDIAVCLCLIEGRHKCSNALIEDFISLLRNIIVDAEEKTPKSLFESRE